MKELDLRYELKYTLNPKTYNDLFEWMYLKGLSFKRKYATRKINNIYFDSSSFQSFSENMSGSSSRSKCRLRWYGDSENPEKAQFEVKIRRNGLGTKLTHHFQSIPFKLTNLNNAYELLRKELPKELRVYLDESSRPTLFNCYKREYYETPQGVRMTIDTNLKSSSLLNESFDMKHVARTDIYSVLEFKFTPENKPVAEEVLSSIPIPLGKHSKFVSGLRRSLC